jgi:hypothetical protein
MTLRGENHTGGRPSRVLIRFYFFFATLFCFAQRLRCASAIFFLPAADIVLFFGAVGTWMCVAVLHVSWRRYPQGENERTAGVQSRRQWLKECPVCSSA